MAFSNPFNKQKKKRSNSDMAGEDPYGPSSKAIIYKSELNFISRCILDYPNIETGGELFGFWTQLGTPVVLYAVGPGPKAKHHPTAFIQDPDYVDNIEVEICNRTGLQHIGQWHSHHQLGLAHPSGGDVASMQRGVGQPGFPRMLLCIGNCTQNFETTVNAFNFHENIPSHYIHAKWDIINMESPFRTEINSMFGSRIYVPRTREARLVDIHEDESRNQPISQNTYLQHWLTERVENVELMKGFLKSAETLYPGSIPAAEIMESGEPIVALYAGSIKIMLPYGFPKKSPMYMLVNGKACQLTDSINEESSEKWISLCYLPLDLKFQRWMLETMPKPDISISNSSSSQEQDTTTPDNDEIDLNDEEYPNEPTNNLL